MAMKDARILNLATGALEEGGVTVVAPGFIDPHAHIESSCVTPPDFDLCTLSTTLETPTHS